MAYVLRHPGIMAHAAYPRVACAGTRGARRASADGSSTIRSAMRGRVASAVDRHAQRASKSRDQARRTSAALALRALHAGLPRGVGPTARSSAGP